MPKKIKIRCPLTGKKYHILSKKGQTIIRNYKKYQKYQKNNNNTNTMMGGSYTDNVSQNKIQKTVFSTKTMANIALINGQESILDIIRMESNIIYLLHPCIVLNIANTTVKNAALDFIKNPVIDTIKKLRKYEQLGVDEFIYYASMGLGFKEQKDSLKLFCSEVMPAFQ